MTRVNDQPRKPSEIPLQAEIVRARIEDSATIADILDEAARWVASKGWEGWMPGSLSTESIRELIIRQEVYLARIEGETAGTITLQWNDKSFWEDDNDDAGYVHKLAIKRTYAGIGLGIHLLRWAERQALAKGRQYLRLNCMASDTGLREYYEKAGFKHVRNIVEKRGAGSLYEKRI